MLKDVNPRLCITTFLSFPNRKNGLNIIFQSVNNKLADGQIYEKRGNYNGRQKDLPGVHM
jgi:hypothetical protein